MKIASAIRPCGSGLRSQPRTTAQKSLALRRHAGLLTMPIGLAIILFTIVITGLYVRRANSEFDTLTEQIAREALK